LLAFGTDFLAEISHSNSKRQWLYFLAASRFILPLLGWIFLGE
jgi:hypothetical protein